MKVRIRVTPNASKDEILGWEDDPRAGKVLRVRLQAPPVDGKANAALLKFLAKTWGVSKSSLTLLKGQSSRTKLVEAPEGVPLP